jgi:predicted metal-dependent HD superfamily phosphohydrolase
MTHPFFDERGFGTDLHRVPWHEVAAIGIRTTSDGPFADDLFWQFVFDGQVLELPGSWVGRGAVDVILRALPGADVRKVVTAMGSVEDRQYCVWDRDRGALPKPSVLRERFQALAQRVGAVGDASPLAERLLAAWTEPSRHYHDTTHLAECLALLDEALEAGAERDVAELALWFHDAVYDARANDSEERSARWLEVAGAELRLVPELVARAARLVRATAHASNPHEDDALAALVCDVDLAILGRERVRFLEFEDAVRDEYAHVWSLLFGLGRGRFLASLLERSRIFVTPWASARFEATARRNIEELLASPRYAPWRLVRRLQGRSIFGHTLSP